MSAPVTTCLIKRRPAPLSPLLEKALKTREMYWSGASYWETPKGSRSVVPKVGHACFSNLNNGAIKAVHYLCPVSDSLEEAHARFWIRFLRRSFTILPWTSRMVRVRSERARTSAAYGSPTDPGQPKLCVMFKLKECSPNRPTTLCYLTAFRYLSEYPVIVRALYDERKACSTPDDLFRLMQDLHLRHGTVANGHGHGLISRKTPGGYNGYTSDWYSADQSISIAQFAANARRGRGSVHAHFAVPLG